MNDALFHVAGLAFLALAKVKHTLRGYQTPKPYAIDEVDRCIDYDLHIADRYLTHLRDYAHEDVTGRHVIELGPGSDLGVGLILLARGAASYVAFDRHNLAAATPKAFYDRLAERLQIDLAPLSDGRVTFVARDDFDVSALDRRVDLVFSNAAFEHFDDVDGTVDRLSRIVRPGGRIVAEIDLQTHSRWIREADPNNIYRYSDRVYRLFSFPGQPNRVRPDEYRAAFERNGWSDIQLERENALDADLRSRKVHRKFTGRNLDWLSFRLCATKDA